MTGEGSGGAVSLETSWIQQAFAGFTPGELERYRRDPEAIAHLDRMLDGLRDETKVEALRAIINMQVPPNDEAYIFAALLGHLKGIGMEIPTAMRESLRDFDRSADKLAAFCDTFVASFVEAARRLGADLEQAAIRSGSAAVQAAVVEETDRQRLRLMQASQDVLEATKQTILADARRLPAAKMEVKVRLATLGVVLAIALAGYIGGLGTAWRFPHYSDVEQRDLQYGRALREMYRDMPQTTQRWVAHWWQTHPRRAWAP